MMFLFFSIDRKAYARVSAYHTLLPLDFISVVQLVACFQSYVWPAGVVVVHGIVTVFTRCFGTGVRVSK